MNYKEFKEIFDRYAKAFNIKIEKEKAALYYEYLKTKNAVDVRAAVDYLINLDSEFPNNPVNRINQTIGYLHRQKGSYIPDDYQMTEKDRVARNEFFKKLSEMSKKSREAYKANGVDGPSPATMSGAFADMWENMYLKPAISSHYQERRKNKLKEHGLNDADLSDDKYYCRYDGEFLYATARGLKCPQCQTEYLK